MTPARNLSLAAAALAALLIAPAAASAAPQAVDTLDTVDELVLAGDNVVFQKDGAKGTHAFWSTAPGAKPRKLLQLPADPPDGANNYSYDASATRLAWVEEARVSERGGSLSSTYSGSTLPFGGTAAKLDPAPGEGFVGVAGDRVAYIARTGTQYRIVVQDLSAPGTPPRTIDLADGEVPVQLAGNFLAYPTTNVLSDPAQVVVVDLTTGAEVYRTSNVPRQEFSLAPDGVVVTAAVALNAKCSKTAKWYSPAEPTAHAIPLSNLCGVPKAAAGGRLLAMRRGSASRTVELITATLAGDPKVLDVVPASKDGEDGNLALADFEGTTALYAVARCGPSLVLRADVTGSFTPKLRSSACPIALAGGSTLRASRSGKVVVDIRCAAGACPSPANVRLLDGTTNLGGRRWFQDDEEGLTRKRNLVDIQLGPGARKRLIKERRLEVQIAAVAYDLAGRRVKATKNVTITAP